MTADPYDALRTHALNAEHDPVPALDEREWEHEPRSMLERLYDRPETSLLLLLSCTFGLGVAAHSGHVLVLVMLLYPLVVLCRDVAAVLRREWLDAGEPHRE